jgi:RND family efflux transporter MFP subunit
VAANTTVTVPVAQVSRQDLSDELTLTGEFIPFQEVDVMAKVAGYVKTLRVDIGDHVAQGDLLATLEVPELQDEMAKAVASVQAAKADVTTAEGNVQRAKAADNIARLSFTRIQDVAKKDPGLVPRQQVDVSQSHQLEAEAQLASAQAALQAAKDRGMQADSERMRAAAMLQYATIRAPFSGVITKRYANTGSMIQAGTASQSQAMPVVRLAQNNVLRLMLPVPVTAVAQVHIGEPVDVNITTLEKTIQGKVTRFANALDMDTRTMNTEVDVPNPGGTLMPGMYAEIKLHVADRKHALSAPVDAIDGLGTPLQRVFVVRDGRLHLAAVKTGIQTASRVELLSGVSEGDRLVVGRHTGLTEGEPVDIKPVTE